MKIIFVRNPLRQQGPNSQHFIFFVTYEWGRNKFECYNIQDWKGLSVTNTKAYWAHS